MPAERICAGPSVSTWMAGCSAASSRARAASAAGVMSLAGVFCRSRARFCAPTTAPARRAAAATSSWATTVSRSRPPASRRGGVLAAERAGGGGHVLLGHDREPLEAAGLAAGALVAVEAVGGEQRALDHRRGVGGRGERPGEVAGRELAGALLRGGRRLAGALGLPRVAAAEADGDPAAVAVAPGGDGVRGGAGVGKRGALTLEDPVHLGV